MFLNCSSKDITLSLDGKENEPIILTVKPFVSTMEIPLLLHQDQDIDTIYRAMKMALQVTGGVGKLVIDKLKSPDWLNALGWESGVKHVGVWHGMMGSRGGIHPRLANVYGLPTCHDGRIYFIGEIHALRKQRMTLLS